MNQSGTVNNRIRHLDRFFNDAFVSQVASDHLSVDAVKDSWLGIAANQGDALVSSISELTQNIVA